MNSTYPEAELIGLAEQILRDAGVPDENAAIVAHALVEADVRGMSSHGLLRLPVYVQRILKGGVDPAATGVIERESPSTVLIDGQAGLGQVIALRAMREAVERARVTGICFVGVRNSNHFGEAAHYLSTAIQEGMIAIVGTNGSPNMPPWGGTTHLIGTLPLAIGIPAGEETPIQLDMALGAVSKGKILNAAKAGTTIPDGWGVDRRGEPTNDPNAVLDGGWTPPIGGHKGFGLLVALEVLSGVLNGAAVGREVGDLYGVDDQPQDLGHFFVVINVEAFLPRPEFERRVDEMIGSFRSSDLAPGVDKIRMPGEIEAETATTRRNRGVPMNQDLMQELHELAHQLAVTRGTRGTG